MCEYLKHQAQYDVPSIVKARECIRPWRICCLRMAETREIRHLDRHFPSNLQTRHEYIKLHHCLKVYLLQPHYTSSFGNLTLFWMPFPMIFTVQTELSHHAVPSVLTGTSVLENIHIGASKIESTWEMRDWYSSLFGGSRYCRTITGGELRSTEQPSEFAQKEAQYPLALCHLPPKASCVATWIPHVLQVSFG